MTTSEQHHELIRSRGYQINKIKEEIAHHKYKWVEELHPNQIGDIITINSGFYHHGKKARIIAREVFVGDNYWIWKVRAVVLKKDGTDGKQNITFSVKEETNNTKNNK